MLSERLKGKKLIVDDEVMDSLKKDTAEEGYEVLDKNIRNLVKTMKAQTLCGETPSEVEEYVMKKLEEYETEIWNMSEPDFMLSLIDEIFEGVEEMKRRD